MAYTSDFVTSNEQSIRSGIVSLVSLAMGFFSLVSEEDEGLTSPLLICPRSAALLTLNP